METTTPQTAIVPADTRSQWVKDLAAKMNEIPGKLVDKPVMLTMVAIRQTLIISHYIVDNVKAVQKHKNLCKVINLLDHTIREWIIDPLYIFRGAM